MALTDIKVRSTKPGGKAYKLTDGDGMFLLVHPNGSRYWRLRYRFGGKEKTLALGIKPLQAHMKKPPAMPEDIYCLKSALLLTLNVSNMFDVASID